MSTLCLKDVSDHHKHHLEFFFLFLFIFVIFIILIIIIDKGAKLHVFGSFDTSPCSNNLSSKLIISILNFMFSRSLHGTGVIEESNGGSRVIIWVHQGHLWVFSSLNFSKCILSREFRFASKFAFSNSEEVDKLFVSKSTCWTFCNRVSCSFNIRNSMVTSKLNLTGVSQFTNVSHKTIFVVFKVGCWAFSSSHIVNGVVTLQLYVSGSFHVSNNKQVFKSSEHLHFK